MALIALTVGALADPSRRGASPKPAWRQNPIVANFLTSPPHCRFGLFKRLTETHTKAALFKPNPNSSRSPVQARPSKPKPGQANPNKILPVLPLPSGAPQGAPSFFDDRAKVKRIPIFTKELFEKFVASSSAFLRPIDPGGSEVGNTYRCLDAQSLFRLSPNVHIALRLNVRRVAPRLDVLGRRFLFRSRFCLLEERFRPRRYDCRHNRGSDAAKNQLPILRGSYKIIWMS